ncbi:hypothetical protein J7L67_08525 [bacterium]|nr:hypothetical protein [bacterium]
MTKTPLIFIYVYGPSYKSYLYPEAFFINEQEIISDKKEVDDCFKSLLQF